MTNFQNWLSENKTIILLSLALILIFIITSLVIWGKRLNLLKKQLEKINWQLQKNAEKLNWKEEKLSLESKGNKTYSESLEKEEKRLIKLNEILVEKEKIVASQEKSNLQKDQEFQKNEQFLNYKQKEIEKKIQEVSQMSKEDAKKLLFTQLQEELKEKLDRHAQQEIQKRKEAIEKEATNLICSALERYSTSLIFSKTVNFLTVNDRSILSKIIGKDGRNINFFRKITGADIIIDQNKDSKKNQEIILEISSFNSLRREIATRTLKKLITEQKITPLYIEKTFTEISKEIEKIIQQTAEEACQELRISFLHPELMNYLGKLKFRTSYGQNVLEHCLEVAKLAGLMAIELGLDPELARRSGLLHDIGKAVEDNDNASHVTNGIVLAKQYGESEIVINAIASHHRDVPADNFYSLLVASADTLSAARPGARGQQLEAYLTRMENLENLVQELPGVKKIYAFQAGREVWVLVDSQKVADHQLFKLSQEVKKKIQEQIIIPGDVTVSVLREKKITQKLVNIVPFRTSQKKLNNK